MEEAAELGSLDGTVAASPHSDIETAHIRDRAQLVESELVLSDVIWMSRSAVWVRQLDVMTAWPVPCGQMFPTDVARLLHLLYTSRSIDLLIKKHHMSGAASPMHCMSNHPLRSFWVSSPSPFG